MGDSIICMLVCASNLKGRNNIGKNQIIKWTNYNIICVIHSQTQTNFSRRYITINVKEEAVYKWNYQVPPGSPVQYHIALSLSQITGKTLHMRPEALVTKASCLLCLKKFGLIHSQFGVV